MKANQKEKVLCQWSRFVKNGLKWKHFTRALYDHLHLHCSFIAHYDRTGFYDHYFTRPEMTRKFFAQFDAEKGLVSAEYGMAYWLNGDYADINTAMVTATKPYLRGIYETSHSAEREHDLAEARRLLNKHNP